MDGTRDELLACPALAADQHVRVRRRHLADELVDLDHSRVTTHEVADGESVLGGGAIARRALARAPVVEHPRQQVAKRVQVKRRDSKDDSLSEV